jgi:hypothetical protein
MDKPASPEQGDILYYGGSAWARLVHGAVGDLLQSGGHGANPVWVSTISALHRYAVVDHTASAELTAADMNKIHTDVGAADDADIEFTLPSSGLTAGDWVTFVHSERDERGIPDSLMNIYGYTTGNRKIMWVATGYTYLLQTARSTYGASITLVYLSNGYWAVLSETSEIPYYASYWTVG